MEGHSTRNINRRYETIALFCVKEKSKRFNTHFVVIFIVLKAFFILVRT